LVCKVKDSKFYQDFCRKEWMYNIALIFKERNFDFDFIVDSTNQFSKPSQFCIAFSLLGLYTSFGKIK